jgi:hypothetical protein
MVNLSNIVVNNELSLLVMVNLGNIVVKQDIISLGHGEPQ